MITTNDENIAKKIRTLRSHGMTTLTLDRHKGHAFSYDVTALGFNYRLDEIHSALGIVQLEKLQKSNERRLTLATKYQQALSEIQGLSVISGNGISVSSNHILPVLLPEEIDRAKFMEYMKQNGIQTSIHYPPHTSLISTVVCMDTKKECCHSRKKFLKEKLHCLYIRL
nr:DegT/DnrJ/EryC1/StrS family aminotransferase [Candidatus Kuenenia stuttgartiensis]